MTQPEALRLADDLLKYLGGNTATQAAAKLRRLHAENEALRGANNAFGQRQEWWNERMFVLEQQRDELLAALRWIDKRCPQAFMDCPLHTIHREMAHDAGACARAAIAKAQQ